MWLSPSITKVDTSVSAQTIYIMMWSSPLLYIGQYQRKCLTIRLLPLYLVISLPLYIDNSEGARPFILLIHLTQVKVIDCFSYTLLHMKLHFFNSCLLIRSFRTQQNTWNKNIMLKNPLALLFILFCAFFFCCAHTCPFCFILWQLWYVFLC